jgi:hypothetical protein
LSRIEVPEPRALDLGGDVPPEDPVGGILEELAGDAEELPSRLGIEAVEDGADPGVVEGAGGGNG